MDRPAKIGRERLGVPMVDPEIVKQLRAFETLGWGSKRFACEPSIARNPGRGRSMLRSKPRHGSVAGTGLGRPI